MAYDEDLAARVRDALALEPDLAERKMLWTSRADPMKGMVYVGRTGTAAADLRAWVERGAAIARSLPPK